MFCLNSDISSLHPILITPFFFTFSRSNCLFMLLFIPRCKTNLDRVLTHEGLAPSSSWYSAQPTVIQLICLFVCLFFQSRQFEEGGVIECFLEVYISCILQQKRHSSNVLEIEMYFILVITLPTSVILRDSFCFFLVQF